MSCWGNEQLDRTAIGVHLIIAGHRVGLELEGAEFLAMEKMYDEVNDEPGEKDSVRIVEWVLKKVVALQRVLKTVCVICIC